MAGVHDDTQKKVVCVHEDRQTDGVCVCMRTEMGGVHEDRCGRGA